MKTDAYNTCAPQLAAGNRLVDVRALRPALAATGAVILFNILFAGPRIDFWYQLAATVVACCVAAAFMDSSLRKRLMKSTAPAAAGRALAIGLISAGMLYGIFWLGNNVARALFPWAATGIDNVYAFKSGAELNMVLLIGLVIGPGEEIFWRGYVQHTLSSRYRVGGVLVVVAAYTLAHLASANPMLIMASCVCAVFWGLLYAWKRSLWINIVSHVAWDLSVFIFWPFT